MPQAECKELMVEYGPIKKLVYCEELGKHEIDGSLYCTIVMYFLVSTHFDKGVAI